LKRRRKRGGLLNCHYGLRGGGEKKFSHPREKAVQRGRLSYEVKEGKVSFLMLGETALNYDEGKKGEPVRSLTASISMLKTRKGKKERPLSQPPSEEGDGLLLKREKG